jgi:hypothetical protein
MSDFIIFKDGGMNLCINRNNIAMVYFSDNPKHSQLTNSLFFSVRIVMRGLEKDRVIRLQFATFVEADDFLSTLMDIPSVFEVKRFTGAGEAKIEAGDSTVKEKELVDS